jgi:hypothetical protein
MVLEFSRNDIDEITLAMRMANVSDDQIQRVEKRLLRFAEAA